MLPAFTLLVVCGVRGLGRVGRQHLAVALALEVPLAVAVTKADIAEAADLDAVASELRCQCFYTSTSPHCIFSSSPILLGILHKARAANYLAASVASLCSASEQSCLLYGIGNEEGNGTD